MTPHRERTRIDLELEFGQSSDCGPARTLNEDYAHGYLPKDQEQHRNKGAIFLVADGMGGHQAGEVASRQAVEQVLQEYYADKTHAPGESLVRAFKAANQVLHASSLGDIAKAGMGTTLVAVVILGQRVYVANVGDSRAYLVNHQGISQITEDHSWVKQQVQAGLLTPEEAARHPQRNLITRALGAKASVEVDLYKGELFEGDALLLCTDGLSGALSQQQMAQVIQTQPPRRAAAQLVAQAGAQRGDDNATALVVKAIVPQATEPAVPQQASKAAEPPAPSGPALAAIGRWLRSPGRLQLGKQRQQVVVGLATLVFLSCLCAAVAVLPAVSQRLAGDPVGAPHLAPIHDQRLEMQALDQLATYLGYASPNDMIAAHPGQFESETPAWGDVWPARPGVFLIGSVRDLSCQEQTCTFQLRMHDKNYKVRYNQRSQQDEPIDLRGRQVRVFGYQPDEEATVDAQFIERGSRWWAWWQKAWTTVYEIQPWDREVWVYGIVDRNPNGLLTMDDRADVEQGDQVLVLGMWRPEKRSAVFVDRQAYRLVGGRYVPLESGPIPIPLPTVTLMPTNSIGNRQ